MRKLTMLLAAAAVVGLTAGMWSPSEQSAPSAKALEGSLLAPCCWGGTLDNHDSPLAAELRTEIETRAGKGEETAAIEHDLVERYGAKMKAMPRAGAFSNALVLALDAGILALAGLVLLVARWRKSASEGGADREDEKKPRELRDVYDDRIDQELAELET